MEELVDTWGGLRTLAVEGVPTGPRRPGPVLSYLSLLVRSRFQPIGWSHSHHCAICDLWGPELL